MIRTITAAALLLATASPAMAAPVTHKFKHSGDGWRGRPWVGVVVEQDGLTFRPRRTEQTSAFSAIVGSWADYPAVAIRACRGAAASFTQTDCVTAEGPAITLPDGADPAAYLFEFRYRYGDTIRQDTFSF
jgi:hypothetical protein